MRELIILALILFVSNASINAQTSSETFVEDSKKLGLLSYLTTIKYLGEYKMANLANNPQFKVQAEKAKKFSFEYNMLKLSVDRFINQLNVDLYQKNNIKDFKLINKFLKDDLDVLPSRLAEYDTLLIEMNSRILGFTANYFGSMNAIPSMEEFVGGGVLVHTIIADARGARTKKITLITAIINEQKLSPIKDLTEEKKPAK